MKAPKGNAAAAKCVACLEACGVSGWSIAKSLASGLRQQWWDCQLTLRCAANARQHRCRSSGKRDRPVWARALALLAALGAGAVAMPRLSDEHEAPAPQQRPAHAWPDIGRATWTENCCDANLLLLSLELSGRRPQDTATTPGPLCPTAGAGHPDPLASPPSGRAHRFEPAWGSPAASVPAARTRPDWCVCARFAR